MKTGKKRLSWFSFVTHSSNLISCILRFYIIISMRTMMDLTDVYAMLATVVGIPVIFVHGLNWTNPCKSSFSVYWIITEFHGISANLAPFYSAVNFPIKFLVVLLNQWMWSFAVHGGVVNVGVLNTIIVSNIHLSNNR